MAHDVFISHSTKDKTVADAVCAAVENAGIRCWVAPRDVQPGRSFAGEITRAIQHSKIMVLIFSAHSNNSEQVLREVQLAVNAHLHIIQFRIEDVHLNDDLRYFLSTPHWLDALTPPLEAHLHRLTDSVKTLLAPPELGSAEAVEDDRETPRFSMAADRRHLDSGMRPGPSFLQNKRKLIAAAVAAGFVLLLIWWIVHSARQPVAPKITNYTPAPVAVPSAIPEYSVGPEHAPQTSWTVHPSAEEIYRQQTEPSVAPQLEIPVRRRAILQHEDRVNDVNFSPDGRFIVTASNDKTAQIWDAKTGQGVGEPIKHGDNVQKAMFTPDGRLLMTVSNRVCIWDAETHKQVGEPLGRGEFKTAELSPNGKRIAVMQRDDTQDSVWATTTEIVDTEKREVIGAPIRGKGSSFQHVIVFSADSMRLVTGVSENNARIFDVETGQPVGDFLRHKYSLASACFSPDGKAVATWAEQTKARVWNAETGEQLLELATQTGDSHCQILYSPDGKYIVALRGQNHPGQIYEAKTGARHGQELPLPYPPGAFSPDSKKLVTFGYGRGEDVAPIWDVETGRILSRKLKHDGAISTIRFSPDGNLLVTGSEDRTARVWEIGAR